MRCATRSESIAALALGVGFATSTMGDISVFTLMSAVLLAIAALVIVYRMQWVRLMYWGFS